MHQARREAARDDDVVEGFRRDRRDRAVGAHEARGERGALADLEAILPQGLQGLGEMRLIDTRQVAQRADIEAHQRQFGRLKLMRRLKQRAIAPQHDNRLDKALEGLHGCHRHHAATRQAAGRLVGMQRQPQPGGGGHNLPQGLRGPRIGVVDDEAEVVHVRKRGGTERPRGPSRLGAVRHATGCEARATASR